MNRENGSKLVQRIDPNLWRPNRHRAAHRGVTHPGWDLPGDAGTNFEIQDLLAATSGPLVEAQPLAVQRMPTILDDDKLRSVC
jgi:hypothetical protein